MTAEDQMIKWANESKAKKKAADDLNKAIFQKLEDLVGLARMGAAQLCKYKSALDEADILIAQYRKLHK